MTVRRIPVRKIAVRGRRLGPKEVRVIESSSVRIVPWRGDADMALRASRKVESIEGVPIDSQLVVRHVGRRKWRRVASVALGWLKS